MVQIHNYESSDNFRRVGDVGTATQLSVTANQGLFPGGFTVGPNASALRITVLPKAGDVLSLTFTDPQGPTTIKGTINGGAPVVVDAWQAFTVPVRRTHNGRGESNETNPGRVLTWNIESNGTGSLEALWVDEVIGPVI